MEEFIRNPHSLEDSWWDGPKRFQWVNRNVISVVQHAELYKFLKVFAPNSLGLDIGGGSSGKRRSTWSIEKEPLSIKLNFGPGSDVCARAEDLPFKNESFGYIVSFHTFEHIRGEPREFLKEWLRVLAPNGLLGIVMPDKRYFLHDPGHTKDGEIAYRELEPKEILPFFQNLNVEFLLFDSRKNNFDFDIVVKKLEFL